jgi:hypothetical protein
MADCGRGPIGRSVLAEKATCACPNKRSTAQRDAESRGWIGAGKSRQGTRFGGAFRRTSQRLAGLQTGCSRLRHWLVPCARKESLGLTRDLMRSPLPNVNDYRQMKGNAAELQHIIGLTDARVRPFPWVTCEQLARNRKPRLSATFGFPCLRAQNSRICLRILPIACSCS